MKIAINALSAKIGSGPTFFRNFLPAIADISEHKYCVILGSDQDELKAVIPENVETHVVSAMPRSFIARVAWEQAVLPSLLRRRRVDVLYSTGNVTSLVTSVPTVVVMTTASPFSRLDIDWSTSLKVKLRVLRMASHLSARRAARTIFISDNSRQLLWRSLGVPLDRTAVVPYGWTPFALGHPKTRARPYLLTVSVLMPYKNVERLLRAFDIMVSKTRFEGQLVVAGPVGSPAYVEQLRNIQSKLAHGHRIEFTGGMDQSDLEALYEHALAFVFPSLEETLGIPLQEAMGVGLPIAAADTGMARAKETYFNPCREICGDAAIYFNPFDEEDIADTLGQLVNDDELRAHLASSGMERAKTFSWERTALETLAVLKEAAIPRSGR